jgi:fructose-1,6-bisphosphatase/inositol monophosphatase family enzyme
MNKEQLSEYIEFSKSLAYKAGEIMLKHFHVDVETRIKADKSIVTIADEEINQMVIDEVENKFPTHSVFGEESSMDKKSDLIWVCDPIDGTIPYSKGIPVSVFSLALVDNGAPIVGVVYDPFTKKLYNAVKGGGAYLNDELITVSTLELAQGSTINCEWWSSAPYDVSSVMHDLSVETSVYILNLGCIINSACLVASGQFVASVYPGTNGKNVDIAAVKVIVEEAGGIVTDIHGLEQRYDTDINGAIISNKIVHEKLVGQLKDL